MTSLPYSNSPIDPEMIKIPAFKRKRSLDAKARHPLVWTALDRRKEALQTGDYRRVQTSAMDMEGDVGSVMPDELSSVKSTARSARNTKRVMTVTPRDVHASSFQRISLQQMSILDGGSAAGRGVVENDARRYALVGEVTMVLSKISVSILKLSQGIRLNDTLLFEGESCMFEETVSEMQINRKNVKTAKKGAEIGLKMKELPCNSTRVWRMA